MSSTTLFALFLFMITIIHTFESTNAENGQNSTSNKAQVLAESSDFFLPKHHRRRSREESESESRERRRDSDDNDDSDSDDDDEKREKRRCKDEDFDDNDDSSDDNDDDNSDEDRRRVRRDGGVKDSANQTLIPLEAAGTSNLVLFSGKHHRRRHRCRGESGEWGDWEWEGRCSDDCGGFGRRIRRRECRSEKRGGCPCKGRECQRKFCNLEPCTFPRLSCAPGLRITVSRRGRRPICTPLRNRKDTPFRAFGRVQDDQPQASENITDIDDELKPLPLAAVDGTKIIAL